MDDMKILWRIYLHLTDRCPQEKIPRASGVPLYHIRQIMIPEHFVKRLAWITHVINRDLTVKPPFAKGGKYEIKFTGDDGKFALFIFSALYAARKFIEAVIDNREVLDLSYKAIKVGKTKIKSNYLRAILGHEYSEDEEPWQLPLPYSYQARQIAYNSTHVTGLATGDNASTRKRKQKEQNKAERLASQATDTPSALRSSKRARASKAPKLQSDNSATLTLDDIATEMGMDKKKVRALCRQKLDKPEDGWQWPIASKKAILKKLRA